MINIIADALSSLINNFILLLINPFDMLIVVAAILYAEKIIIKSMKDSSEYNHLTRIKIRQVI